MKKKIKITDEDRRLRAEKRKRFAIGVILLYFYSFFREVVAGREEGTGMTQLKETIRRKFYCDREGERVLKSCCSRIFWGGRGD